MSIEKNVNKNSTPEIENEIEIDVPKPREFSFLPDAAILNLLASLPEDLLKITGHSLPHLCSGRQTLIVQDCQEKVSEVSVEMQHRGVSVKRTDETPEETRCYYKIDATGEEFRIYFRKPGMQTTGMRPLLSTDRLLLDAKQNRWTGDESDLSDLKERTLRPEPESVKSSGAVLELATLASRLNASLTEDLIETFSGIFKREEADELPRRFLQKQLSRIVTGYRPSRGFQALDQLGALDWFLPELATARGLEQNRFHRYDIYTHSVFTCDAVPYPDLILRLAGLFHDLGKVDTRKEKPNGEATFHNHELVSARHAEKIMRRFSYPPALGKRVRFLVRNHMFHYTSDWSDKAVRRFSNKVDHETLEDLITLRLADRKGSGKKQSLPRAVTELIQHIQEVRARESELKVRDLEVGGNELKELGIEPGPIMGNILQQLLDKVKTGELPNEREALLRKVAELTEYNKNQ